MFTFEQIIELIELVGKRQLGGLELEKAGFRLKIEGQPPAPVAAPMPQLAGPPSLAAPLAPAAPSSSPLTAPAPAASEGAAAKPSDGAHILTSPIVGTFYRSPAPDADPYVDVGSRVSRGQVLCIVEAMKLMNEIESDVDGVIEEIYTKNAQPVEFGEPLFAIRPS